MEASTAPVDLPPATRAATMAEAFRLTVEDAADRVAVRTKDDEVSLTWTQLRDRVDALAGGLAGLGVGRRDTVALLLSNRPEFYVADLAVMTLGATPFSIYATSPPDQIAYVIADAGARVALVERALLEGLLAARADLPDLEHVVVLEGAQAGEGLLSWSEVEGADPAFDAATAWQAVAPDDPLTLIYTSGTTGPPKGVELVHRNMLAAVRTSGKLIAFPPGSKVISWLPNAHVAERTAHLYLPIAYGIEVTCCPVAREITAYLPAVRPTWFFAVPRIWEKLKAGLEVALSTGEGAETKRAWLAAAVRKVELEQAGEPVPAEVAERAAEGEAKLFAGLRAMLGLDRFSSVNVGAAPTPPEVLTFFHAIGIPVGELWGMSETCGVGACNPPGRIKIGTVGPASPDVELKLADEPSGDEGSARRRGELLMRAESVMVGYRNQPGKTAEAIDADGWLHTGDIAEIDDDGYVRIVDRMKEIIINAAGKNMSPANIESTLKAASPLIGNACVIGDAKPFNTALIVLDADFAPAWAAQQGLSAAGLADLAGQPAMLAAVQAGVDAANAKLARVEQIKKFHLVGGDWLPGGDELTPTMKLKRKPIGEKYAEEIAALYA
jgi:long-subunit acyl-CoA synthetase (AMP-forming)